MKVYPVPVLQDNYAYLLVDEASRTCAVVDPGKDTADDILAAAKKFHVDVVGVLVTHHHWDHAGGVKDFLGNLGKEVPVYGGDDRIECLTNKVGNGDSISIVDGVKIKVYFTPCHTTGHVLYLCESANQEPVLFTGDTLFIGGCGRFFEGTAEQMEHALCNVIAGLSNNTLIYCGHEYTQSNLKFAMRVEKGNEALQMKVEEVDKKRKNNEFTIPSTVGDEKLFNPFMRLSSPEIRTFLGVDEKASGAEVMGLLRELKNKG